MHSADGKRPRCITGLQVRRGENLNPWHRDWIVQVFTSQASGRFPYGLATLEMLTWMCVFHDAESIVKESMPNAAP